MMSEDGKSEGESGMMSCCASCGVAAGDDVKLKNCNACYLIKYCSIKCQKEHRPKHKRACKKRAAELHDEILFKQPESTHLGDCPICCLPLSLVESKSSLYSCCSKMICNGCVVANHISVAEKEEEIRKSCPFCRQPMSSTQKEADRKTMKRIEVNDPVALRQWGYKCFSEGDHRSAFEYWTRAAKLGDASAHYELSHSYKEGKGGVEKDEKLELYHLEQAAICGHPEARHNLGCAEGGNRRFDRSTKHLNIAATQGDDDSIKMLMEIFKGGFVSKENLAAALRGHQAAVDATKSPQREAAEAFGTLWSEKVIT